LNSEVLVEVLAAFLKASHKGLPVSPSGYLVSLSDSFQAGRFGDGREVVVAFRRLAFWVIMSESGALVGLFDATFARDTLVSVESCARRASFVERWADGLFKLGPECAKDACHRRQIHREQMERLSDGLRLKRVVARSFIVGKCDSRLWVAEEAIPALASRRCTEI
jgi:hypothetical protein